MSQQNLDDDFNESFLSEDFDSREETSCPFCHGEGTLSDDAECSRCYGSGSIIPGMDIPY